MIANAAKNASRLILQDPVGSELAVRPQLRLSLEISEVGSVQGLDRETAEKTWSSLQLQPEEALQNRDELKKINTQLQMAQRELASAKTNAVQMQAALLQAQKQPWNHPLVYGVSAAALLLGAAWLSERKKRLAAPDGALQAQPDATVPVQAGQTEIDFRPHTPWWQRVRQWARLRSGANKAHLHESIASTQTGSSAGYSPSTMMGDETSAVSVMGSELQDPDFLQAELLSHTRIKPHASESAMSHLCDLRLTVQALQILQQNQSASLLLRQHIDAVPATAAWAYLEYMSLCTQTGQRDDFELVRQRYRTQFNRLAPYWMEPISASGDLIAYDRPLAELSAVWPAPESKNLIERWLLGNPQERRLLQLPAYRDLFDLYDILQILDENTPVPQDFLPTVSLLDLDYEFSIEVKLDAAAQNAALPVPTVKTGDFDVDVDLSDSKRSALSAPK